MYSQRALPPASVEKIEHIGLMRVCERRATVSKELGPGVRGHLTI